VEKEPSRRPDLGGPVCIPQGAPAPWGRAVPGGIQHIFRFGERGIARAIAREIRAAGGGLKGREGNGCHGPWARPAFHEYHRLRGDNRSRSVPEGLEPGCPIQLALPREKWIGLIPEAACERESEWMRQLVGFDEETKSWSIACIARWRGREAKDEFASFEGFRCDSPVEW